MRGVPTRYIFNHTHLLRRPDVRGPIFFDDEAAEKVVELTFADYTLNELALRNTYEEAIVTGYFDNGLNEWQQDFKATIHGFRIMDRRHFVVDNIDHVTVYGYYDRMDRIWFVGTDVPLTGRLQRLLWRITDNDHGYISIRHWDRLYNRLRPIEPEDDNDWKKNGF
jgi:hypothetical protein